MSLAAVPAYLLSRRVLSQPLALAGAALAVAVPSMLYSGTVMTENAFYPLFLATALALVLVLEQPTLARSGGVIALLVLAFLTRAQAVAVQLARGKAISDLFGRYSTVSGAKYPVGSVAKWFVYHLAELDLYVGIAPFAALALLVVLFPRL